MDMLLLRWKRLDCLVFRGHLLMGCLLMWKDGRVLVVRGLFV